MEIAGVLVGGYATPTARLVPDGFKKVEQHGSGS